MSISNLERRSSANRFTLFSHKNLDNKSIPPLDFVKEDEIKDQEAEPILSEPGLEGLNISQEELIVFYEKEAIRDKKNIAKLKSILS
ncbi:26768_t:CDS:1, partial [Dentiscutata erythropus]